LWLTTGTDTSGVLIGSLGTTSTAGNDTFVGNTAAGALTLTSLDNIDGGNGTDSLSIAVTGGAVDLTAAVGAKINSIENVTVSAVGAVTVNSTDYSGTTTLATSSVGNSTLTAATTTDIISAIGAPTGAGAAVVNGGKNITMTINDTATTNAASGNTVVVGGTTKNVGTVTIVQTETVSDAADLGIATGTITVTGGTAVNVTSLATTGAASNAADVVTTGQVTVNGNGTVTSVAVTQSAQTAAFGGAGITAIKNTAGVVAITDLNTALKADSIKSVTLTNFGASTLTGNALETLSLTGGAAIASGGFAITQSAGVTTAGSIPTALTLNTSGLVGAVTDTSDQYSKLTINSAANATVAALDFTKVLSLDVAGAGVTTISALTSLGATAAITSTGGGLTITPTLGNDQSFTGGAGKETITIAATTKAITTGDGDDSVTVGSSFGTGGSVDAGLGSDTLVMTAAEAITASASTTYDAKIAGFEKLTVGAAAAGGTIDLDNLDNLNELTLGAVTAGQTLAFTNAASGLTLTTPTSGGTVTVAQKDATGTSDTAAVTVSATTAQTVNSLTLTGYESLTFNTSRSTATTAINHVLTTLTAADATSIVVSGSAGLTLGNGFAGVKLTSYDASGVTGTAPGSVTYTTAALTTAATIKGGAGADNLNAALATKAVSIFGNDGNDTIVGSAVAGAANTLDGGSGDDSLTGGLVADTIIGGAGVDTFVMTNSTRVGSGTVDGMAVNLSDAAVTQASIFTGSAKFLSGAAVAGLAANTATDLFSNESGTNASVVDTLSGIESVTTGAGQDYVVGSSVTNVISTGNGIDWISGGDGADFMSADTAADGGDIDRVIGGTGDDTYVYTDAGAADIYIEAASSGFDSILVSGNVSIATLTVGTTATAAGAVGLLSNFEQIVIGTGNTATVLGEQVTGLTLNVTEVAAGTSGLTVTAVAAGTTNLSGLTFSSGTYVGAAGTVLAGNALTSGTDLVTVNGGAGAETIVAASIATVINAGAGIDTITLGAGNDRIILDQITNANREDITGFSTSGDILVLDRSALATLGSADDVIDAAEINVSAAGVKTAAADIIVLTDGVARTAAQAETLLQGVYVAGGASGAGAVAVVYLSSVTNALVVAYDANVDVGTDGTGLITIVNLVGLVGADLANITAADFAFQA
jgi:S-layer protein